MHVLLDTHAFLWFIENNPRLSPLALRTLEDGTTEALISVGSLWEIAIKTSIGKLRLGQPFETLIPAQLAWNDFELLGITVEHLSHVATLPFHHRDPFDRLLVAQAIVERLPLVSADATLDAYPVNRLW